MNVVSFTGSSHRTCQLQSVLTLAEKYFFCQCFNWRSPAIYPSQPCSLLTPWSQSEGSSHATDTVAFFSKVVSEVELLKFITTSHPQIPPQVERHEKRDWNVFFMCASWKLAGRHLVGRLAGRRRPRSKLSTHIPTIAIAWRLKVPFLPHTFYLLGMRDRGGGSWGCGYCISSIARGSGSR